MAELDLVALAKGRKELEAWQSPTDFIAKVDEIAATIKSDALFNRTELTFLLDAMVLATFVQYRTTETVRLTPENEQWPDGQIGTAEAPVNIEVTEVLEEGRRRGQEYRDEGQPLDGNAEEWRKRALEIPAQLEKAIKRKKQKGYGKKCKLVIYVNMSNYGILQKETEAEIAAIKAKHSADFQEICVLWQEKLL